MVGLEPKHRKDFQLERIILFSDAVFAIAITLLIIEIKVPHLEHSSDTDLFNALTTLIPKFIGFFVSFLLIGQYWITHHKLFGFVESYNGRLLWLNLLFLMSIVTMPFSSAVYSEHILLNLGFIIYCLNIMASGIINFLLWRYIGKIENNISNIGNEKELLNYFTLRSLAVPLSFFFALVVSLINPWIGKSSLALIAPIMMFISKKYSKVIAKHKKDLAEENKKKLS